MFQNRNLTSDLFALCLLVLVIFLGVALFTYDASDPIRLPTESLSSLFIPDNTTFPPAEQISNACGRWGAVVADLLLTSLGIGAYYLVISLAVVDFFLLRREDIDTPLVRTIGWLTSLVGLTTIIAFLAPTFSLGPVIGPGGYLGALGKGLLQLHFATAGSLILAFSLLLGGLLLCTDYVLLRMAATLLGLGFGGAQRWLPARKTTRSTEESVTEAIEQAEEEELEEEEDEYGDLIAVKFRKRPEDEEEVDEALDDIETMDEELTDEEQEEPLEEEEEEQPLVIKRRKNARADKEHKTQALRIRNRRDKAEREEVMNRLDEAARHTEDDVDYELPDIDLLLTGDDFPFEEQEREVRRKAKILEKTFANFGFNVRVVEIETGPVIAQYEVELEAGLRLSKITGLADDLAIALRVPSVRIVAPIPGKNTVGIEVPNEQRQVVRLREVIEETHSRMQKMRIPLFLGKDVSGNPLTVDLSSLPHLLIAGRTGTGKSVCLNAIITSILMTRRPDEVRMLMIDPKMVELSGYGRLPHLMHPVVTDMRKAEAILAWAVEKMEERYSLLARAGVRHISSYNQLDEDELMDRLQPETDEERDAIPTHLPFIVIVADEIADMMMTAGKEVEQHIIRLAQKSRAVGIHLILATQKPTVDVITGLIKSNLPARLSFQVASRTDSRVVLDEMGADKLLGNGDMLFLWPGTSTLLRGQGTYLDDEEIERVVDAVATTEQNFVSELVNLQVEEGEEEKTPGQLKKRDDLYDSAVDIVVREGRGSVSLLQRSLGIGYGRAARLIDFMAEDGIVGSYAGSQAREVLISIADWERMQGNEPAEEDAPPAAKKRSNRVNLREEVEDEELYDEEDEYEVEEEDFYEVEAEDEEFEDDEDYEPPRRGRYSKRYS